MLEKANDQCVEEIVKFVNDIVQTRQELLKNKVADCDTLLKRFEYVNSLEDSGFESEPISEIYDKCLIPSATLLSKFETNDYDLIFEHSLKHLCVFIQNSQITTESTRVELCVDAVEKCLCYLEETDSSVPFREIIQTNLESMIEKIMSVEDNEEHFNFAMELFRRFGSMKCLQEIVTDLLLKYLDMFSCNLKRQKADAAFTFCFETDFSRANTMLLVLLQLKRQNKDMITEDNDTTYRTPENFVDMDDFFTLGFSDKHLSKQACQVYWCAKHYREDKYVHHSTLSELIHGISTLLR